MATSEVAILVRARDEASKVFQQVNKNASGLQSTLTKGFAGAAVGIGGAVAAIGGGVIVANKFIDKASDLNESLSKANVVFGQNAKIVDAWAKGASRDFGLPRQAALEYAGTLGNLFSALGLTSQQQLDMSQSTVELAADLASFNNIGIDEALEKLRAGLVGEAEPLRTLGVNINEATVKAKAMELGLAGASGELTEAAKVQARYALIMEQTSLAQGDFDRTSDGLANKQRILAAEWDNMQAIIGQKLLPLKLALADVLLNKVLPGLEGAFGAAQAFGQFLSAGLTGNVEAAVTAFNKLPEPLQAIALWLAANQKPIEDIAGLIKDTLVAALEGWMKILQDLQGPLDTFAGWLVDNHPVLIGLAIAIAGVLILLVGWPAILFAAAIAAGVLRDKVDELRDSNEGLDDTLSGLQSTIEFLRPAIDFVSVGWGGWTLVMYLWNETAKGFTDIVGPSVRDRIDEIRRAVDLAKDVFYFFKDAIYSVRDAFYALRDAINSLPRLSWDDIIPDVPGLNFSNLPGPLAMGGAASGWQWVGERGPELAYFGQPAQVYPNGQSEAIAAGMGGDHYEMNGVTIILPNVERPDDFARELTREQDRYFRGA